MEDKILQIGNVTFVADADLHTEKSIEIGERTSTDGIVHPDGREGYFIADEDLAYLLLACSVLSGFLSRAEDEAPEVDDDSIPDLPGREGGSNLVH